MANTIALSVASGTAASSGDNSIISAPANGLKIVIVGLIIQNETTTANTMQLYNGASSGNKILARCLGQNQGDGLTVSFPGDTRLKLTAETALVLKLSAAAACGYTIWYYTE